MTCECGAGFEKHASGACIRQTQSEDPRCEFCKAANEPHCPGASVEKTVGELGRLGRKKTLR